MNTPWKAVEIPLTKKRSQLNLVDCTGDSKCIITSGMGIEEDRPIAAFILERVNEHEASDLLAELTRLRAIETAAKEWRASDCAFFVNGVPTSTPELQARFEKACKTLRDALEGGK